MKRNIKTKIIATMLLVMLLVSNIIEILPAIKSFASNNIGDKKFIQSIGTVQYHLKSRAVSSRWICNYSSSWIL